MVQAGRRAVYEPAAKAFEKPTPSNETEYRRKVRMFEHCWEITLRGSMLKRLPFGYLVEVVSHRLLRYGSGLLHLVLLATSLAARRRGARLPGRARRPAAPARGRARRRRDRPLLHARHLGDGRLALELPSPRRPRDVGGGGGDTLNRTLDVAIAGAGLALASPFLAAAALAVKLGDGGPVLFKQTRVGKDGRDFELLKLRTMVVGAETQGAGYAVNQGDSRITRAGRFLRRTSLDELPQLWNVVRGDMSLIGPRPTLRYQVERYSERQRRRLEVLPGITGWAQIHGRASLSWDERIELDVWYVDHRSPRTDLLILLRTPLALFGGTYKGETGGWRSEPSPLAHDRPVGERVAARPRSRSSPSGTPSRIRYLGGFDAREHVAYAHEHLAAAGCPEGGASYTPPGFYVLAGAGDPSSARRCGWTSRSSWPAPERALRRRQRRCSCWCSRGCSCPAGRSRAGARSPSSSAARSC